VGAEQQEGRPPLIDLVDRAPDGLAVVTADGIITYANRAAAELLAPRDAEATGKPLGRPVTAGRPQQIEVIDSWGHFRVAEMVASEMRGADGELVYVVSIRDLTAHQEQQRALTRQLDEHDDVLSLVYREATDMLTGLNLRLEELDQNWEGLEELERRHHLRMIRRRLDQLTSTVTAWLNGLRSQSSSTTEDRPAEVLLDIVLGNLDSLGEQAPLVQIRVPVDVTVSALPMHVWTILRQLLSNAFVHGRAPVTLVAVPDGDMTRIEVTDHGDGIDPRVGPRLYERYVRRVTEGPDVGEGLGLWISRALAEAYGGTLHHEPVPEGGTRFVCRLPSHRPRSLHAIPSA